MISNASVDESWNKRRCRSKKRFQPRFTGNRDIYVTGETIRVLAAIKVSPSERARFNLYYSLRKEYHYNSRSILVNLD